MKQMYELFFSVYFLLILRMITTFDFHELFIWKSVLNEHKFIKKPLILCSWITLNYLTFFSRL